MALGTWIKQLALAATIALALPSLTAAQEAPPDLQQRVDRMEMMMMQMHQQMGGMMQMMSSMMGNAPMGGGMGGDMGGGMMGSGTMGHGDPHGYGAAMQHMQRATMGQPMTGDADRDFLLHMIPHHEAAVAMAEAVLAHGQDPEIKALAEAIIAAQQAEIERMKAWLAAHPAP